MVYSRITTIDPKKMLHCALSRDPSANIGAVCRRFSLGVIPMTMSASADEDNCSPVPSEHYGHNFIAQLPYCIEILTELVNHLIYKTRPKLTCSVFLGREYIMRSPQRCLGTQTYRSFTGTDDSDVVHVHCLPCLRSRFVLHPDWPRAGNWSTNAMQRCGFISVNGLSLNTS